MKLLALGLAVLALTPTGSRTPVRVQVTASEFELALSRRSVKQGRAIIELVNLGEDPHDLALRRNAKGARTYRTEVVRPEGQTSIVLRLYPGRYTLWCTVGDHRQHGMVATLTVRR
jgi:hypothetical protein